MACIFRPSASSTEAAAAPASFETVRAAFLQQARKENGSFVQLSADEKKNALPRPARDRCEKFQITGVTSAPLLRVQGRLDRDLRLRAHRRIRIRQLGTR